MLIDHWPLAGLRLTTPRLELRLPDPEELAELGALAAGGIHPPEEMPFLFPWTDLPPAERARSVLQHHWRTLGAWTPGDWSLLLTVFHEGRPVGLQDVGGKDFAVLREVSTGSWLGRAHQGRGIGTEMRHAVLHLAFAGLGATDAISGAFSHNLASQHVSRKAGYRPDGLARVAVRDQPVTEQRYRLTRAEWEATSDTRPPVTVAGLEPCLPLFGV
ncbi:GNAT family N-acetyltransferase [Streptomyces hainanensis]|uniref:N-acetyltransferase n=1 Tax=Streptomyces hainanensis TaxID=402648 RepID=A0A4R4SY39_9ACTN|nr:GNAT family protein [Streptomyces hainanensis]TDC68206.1 N-acetyltransferase [Streptomyces hainanensis]